MVEDIADLDNLLSYGNRDGEFPRATCLRPLHRSLFAGSFDRGNFLGADLGTGWTYSFCASDGLPGGGGITCAEPGISDRSAGGPAGDVAGSSLLPAPVGKRRTRGRPRGRGLPEGIVDSGSL